MSALDKYPREVLQAMFSKLNAAEKAIWNDLLDIVDEAKRLIELVEANDQALSELEAQMHRIAGGESH